MQLKLIFFHFIRVLLLNLYSLTPDHLRWVRVGSCFNILAEKSNSTSISSSESGVGGKYLWKLQLLSFLFSLKCSGCRIFSFTSGLVRVSSTGGKTYDRINKINTPAMQATQSWSRATIPAERSNKSAKGKQKYNFLLRVKRLATQTLFAMAKRASRVYKK